MPDRLNVFGPPTSKSALYNALFLWVTGGWRSVGKGGT